MKTNFLLLIGVFALILTSCESDDTADIIIEDNSVTTINNEGDGGGGDGGGAGDEAIALSGVYTSDLNLTADNEYLVTGAVLMAEGTTLNIAPGTTINVAPKEKISW